MILERNQVEVDLGAVPILRGVTLQIAEGELIGLIGRNGAGKTTTL